MIQITPTIQISNGKNKFHIPTSTILNLIIPDIWSNVLYYYQSIEPLTVGNFNNEYYGYRLVTKEECETIEFIKLFELYLHPLRGKEGVYDLDGFIAMDNINGSYL